LNLTSLPRRRESELIFVCLSILVLRALFPPRHTSSLQNYYVPPIIFAVATDPHDGSERRVTIDGKQRCTSIMRFMDGEIPFVSPATKERFYYRSTHSRGKVLPANLKSRFDMINVVAVEYDNISDETQRDVFRESLGFSYLFPISCIRRFLPKRAPLRS
jgi:hypothetical protein